MIRSTLLELTSAQCQHIVDISSGGICDQGIISASNRSAAHTVRKRGNPPFPWYVLDMYLGNTRFYCSEIAVKVKANFHNNTTVTSPVIAGTIPSKAMAPNPRKHWQMLRARPKMQCTFTLAAETSSLGHPMFRKCKSCLATKYVE